MTQSAQHHLEKSRRCQSQACNVCQRRQQKDTANKKAEHEMVIQTFVSNELNVETSLTCISCINQESHSSIHELRKKQCTVVHAIAIQGECLVDLHIAGLEGPRWIDAKGGLIRWLIEPCFDPSHLLVAKRPAFSFRAITLQADIVRVEAGFYLVISHEILQRIRRMHTHEGPEELRIAIGRGGHTSKPGVEVVTGLD